MSVARERSGRALPSGRITDAIAGARTTAKGFRCLQTRVMGRTTATSIPMAETSTADPEEDCCMFQAAGENATLTRLMKPVARM